MLSYEKRLEPLPQKNLSYLTKVYTEPKTSVRLLISPTQMIKIPPIPNSSLPLSLFQFEVVTVDRQAEIISRHRKEAQYFLEQLNTQVGLEMVAIPGGTFIMGSPESELGNHSNESPQHRVNIAPFFMGKYPITQAQWRVVAGFPQVTQKLEPNPSLFKGDNLPVEKVSWYDCVEFCERLSKKTGRLYRLPSEAEWEYACRAGTTTPFHFGDTITPDLANYNGNYTYGAASKGEYRERTTSVGSFQIANNFGLYDMHGNVWEWCADSWEDNYNVYRGVGTIDTVESDNNKPRLLRGGSWGNGVTYCRRAVRNWSVPVSRYDAVGFRLVIS